MKDSFYSSCDSSRENLDVVYHKLEHLACGMVMDLVEPMLDNDL